MPQLSKRKQFKQKSVLGVGSNVKASNMAATLQLVHARLNYSINLRYWRSTLWSIDNCQNTISADQYYMTISYQCHMSFNVDCWPSTEFLDYIADYVKLNCYNQALFVWWGSFVVSFWDYRKPNNINRKSDCKVKIFFGLWRTCSRSFAFRIG